MQAHGLVGAREPVLIDTGAGVAGYPAALDAYLKARGPGRPSRIVLTHRHRDHMGGVVQLRQRFPGIPVAKMRHRDPALPEPTPKSNVPRPSRKKSRFSGKKTENLVRLMTC